MTETLAIVGPHRSDGFEDDTAPLHGDLIVTRSQHVDGEDPAFQTEDLLAGTFPGLDAARAELQSLKALSRRIEDIERGLGHAEYNGLTDTRCLGRLPYAALMGVGGIVTAAAALIVMPSDAFWLARAAGAILIALNVLLLAHLGGVWARRVPGFHQTARKGVAVILAVAALCEIATLADAVPQPLHGPLLAPLAAIATGVALAFLASDLRHQPNPDIERLTEERRIVTRQRDIARGRMEAGLARARREFEEKTSAIEEAARNG